MEPVTIDIVSALGTAVTAMQTQIGGALPIALGVAGALLAATVGWKVFKRFVRG